MIVEQLRPLAFPVAQLDNLPGNPNRGDVEAVRRSYVTFGQRKPIVARRDGERGVVLAGNTQLEAARRLGWSEIAVVWVDDDDKTAKAYALADNHVAELGGVDSAALTAMLSDVADDDELLAATAYSHDDLIRFMRGSGGGDDDTGPQMGHLEYRLLVECASEQQQAQLLARFESEGLTCRALIG